MTVVSIVADSTDLPATQPTPAALIDAHSPMARSMAGRYRNRGIDLDDLEQVALLGLTKAATRFDPDAGHDFLSYAVPTIRGELRRHFRDHGWTVRPPRRLQEMQARIASAEEELMSSQGRSPRPTEIADHLGVDHHTVVEASAMDGCFTPSSLDAPVGEGPSSLGDLHGVEDREFARLEARILVTPLVASLSERDQLIVGLRYGEGLTQREIADVVHLTQAQVSRVLSSALAAMRARLTQPLPAA